MTSLFAPKFKKQSVTHRPSLILETLESRLVPANAAFDIIGLTALRANPATQGFTGAGISVAVIDTGVDYTHTLLSAAIVKTSADAGGNNVGRDFIGDSEAGSIDGGYRDSTEDNIPEDINGHGTHVAGIIAARNTDIGVAQGAGIIGLKVIGSDNTGSNEDILSALRWVRDNADIYNIRVVNMSLGFGYFTTLDRDNDPFRIAIEDLEDRGVTVVSAAGNDYGAFDPERNSGTPGIGSTLNVGATWKDGTSSNIQWSNSTDFTTGPRRLTSFSQRPPSGAGTLNNEIFAPGAIITSTIPNNGLDPSAPNNLTGDQAGTSQAAPMVAGMVAIMQNASMSLGGRYLTPAEVRQILVSTAQTINDGDDEDDSVVNTNANYHFARIDLAVAQIQTLFNTPGVNDDPNGTMASAQRFFYDFNDPIRISGNLGNDGGYDTERMNGADLPGVFDATFFSGSGNVLVGRKDVDFYSVNFNQPGTMFVRTSDITNSSPTTINTAVRVFDSSGVQIAVNDDFDPFTPNTNDTLYQPFSRLSIPISTPGTYFVAVSGGGNITYNPNVELSGTDAIDSTRPPIVTPPNARSVVGQGDYRVSITFQVVDPNGVLANAVESPVEIGGAVARRGFLGGDNLPNPIGNDFPRPDELVIFDNLEIRQGAVVDTNALGTPVPGSTQDQDGNNNSEVRFRTNPDGTLATITQGIKDVDLFITTAPEDGYISMDIDSLGYSNVRLANGNFGSVAADTRLRAWKVDANNVLTPLASSDNPDKFNDDDSNDPRDANDESQSAEFDSYFEVRVNAGDRILFGVSHWLLDNYDPTTPFGRTVSSSVTINRTVGFYDAFISFRTDLDLNGRIGADIYNLDGRNPNPVSTTDLPIGRLPTASTEVSIGRDFVDGQEKIVGPKDVDFYWYTTDTDGALFVETKAYQAGFADPANTVLTVFELVEGQNGIRSINKVIGSDDNSSLDGTVALTRDAAGAFQVFRNKIYYMAVTGSPNATFSEFRYASGLATSDRGAYSLQSSFQPFVNTPVNAVVPELPPLPPNQPTTRSVRVASGSLGRDNLVNGVRGSQVTGVDLDTFQYAPTASGSVVFSVNPDGEFGSTPSFRVFSKAAGTTTYTPVTGLVTDGNERVNVSKGVAYFVVTSGGRTQINVNSAGVFSTAATRGLTGNYTLSVNEAGTQLAINRPLSATYRIGASTPVTGISVTNNTGSSSVTVTATVNSGVLISGTRTAASLTFTGTQASVNASLAALSYRSVAHNTAGATLTINASTTGGASNSGTVSLTPRTATAYASPDPDIVGKTSLFIQGTAAADTITVTQSGTTFVVTLNGVRTTVAGVNGRVLGYLLAGNDSFNSQGTAIANRIYGGDGDDIVQTGSAADGIFGEGGHDLLAGGLGADVIVGGAGKDILFDGTVAARGGRTLAQTLAVWVALPSAPAASDYASLASFLTVTRDQASRDSIYGQGDLDLFFAALAADVADKASVESVRLA